MQYSVHLTEQALVEGTAHNHKISKMGFGSNAKTKLYSSTLADNTRAVLQQVSTVLYVTGGNEKMPPKSCPQRCALFPFFRLSWKNFTPIKHWEGLQCIQSQPWHPTAVLLLDMLHVLELVKESLEQNAETNLTRLNRNLQ